MTGTADEDRCFSLHPVGNCIQVSAVWNTSGPSNVQTKAFIIRSMCTCVAIVALYSHHHHHHHHLTALSSVFMSFSDMERKYVKNRRMGNSVLSNNFPFSFPLLKNAFWCVTDYFHYQTLGESLCSRTLSQFLREYTGCTSKTNLYGGFQSFCFFFDENLNYFRLSGLCNKFVMFFHFMFLVHIGYKWLWHERSSFSLAVLCVCVSPAGVFIQSPMRRS